MKQTYFDEKSHLQKRVPACQYCPIYRDNVESQLKSRVDHYMKNAKQPLVLQHCPVYRDSYVQSKFRYRGNYYVKKAKQTEDIIDIANYHLGDLQRKAEEKASKQEAERASKKKEGRDKNENSTSNDGVLVCQHCPVYRDSYVETKFRWRGGNYVKNAKQTLATALQIVRQSTDVLFPAMLVVKTEAGWAGVGCKHMLETVLSFDDTDATKVKSYPSLNEVLREKKVAHNSELKSVTTQGSGHKRIRMQHNRIPGRCPIKRFKLGCNYSKQITQPRPRS